MYFDPGSGSLVIQLLIAMGLGIAFYFKKWKYQILRLFSKKGGKDDSAEE